MSDRIRILFVCMAQSVHVARWIDQLRDQGWDLHLFPVEWPCRIHPDLRNVTLHGVGLWRPVGLDSTVRVAGLWPFGKGAYRVWRWLNRWAPGWGDRGRQLARTVSRLRPDLVHSIEMQHAGYLTLEARKRMGRRFPKWIFSCWGNDIFYFGRQPEHEQRIRDVLSLCDCFSADCARDLNLAREFGFRGELLGVFPGPGGFDIPHMLRFRQTPVSSRRAIAVKGYQSWTGRALLVLEAIHRCADVLRDYEIVVYSATPSVRDVAAHVARVAGLRVSVLLESPHDDIVALMGRSRIAIASCVSDGTPNAMLEAMVMGALPIQSDVGSTAEWITDGVNGLLVQPDDPLEIERAIRRAVADDVLVEKASEINARLTAERIARAVVVPQVVEMYRKAVESQTW